MRTFLSLFVLFFLLACGNADSVATERAGTAPVRAAAANAEPTAATRNSRVDAAALEARTLESPDIRVTIPGVQLEGGLLIGQFAEQQYRAMQGTVEGNSIVFRRDEPLRPGHYYAYFQDGASIQMLIDQDQQFSMSAPDPSTAVRDMKVEGNTDTEMLYKALNFEVDQQQEFAMLGEAIRAIRPGTPGYDELQADRAALVDKRLAFQDELFAQAPQSLFTSYKRAGRNPQLRIIRDEAGNLDEKAQVAAFRDEFWDSVDFSDPRLLNTPVIFNKLKRYMKELTPQNANAIIESADKLLVKVLPYDEYFKFAANWITLQYEVGKTPVMDGAAIHVHMIQNYFTRDRAFWADSMTVFGLQQRADQMAHSLVGQPGPDITVPGIDGQPKRLYDSQKEYVAVFMYNPDCEHCIEETPKLVRAYQDLKNDVDIYAIALDTEDAKWKTFVRNNGMQDFVNVYDPTNRSIFKTYYVDNTPELYLLNRDRTIVAKNLKVNQLAEAIALDRSK